MASRKTLLGSVGLMVVGAGTAVAVSHVKIGWSRSDAAPMAQVAADVKPALPPPSSTQVSEARSLGRTFAQVAAQLSPSVVRVSVAKTAKQQQVPDQLRYFFGNPQGGGMGRGQKEHGLGSGFVIDKAGYIVTNNHVVEGADEVKVTFIDGKTVPARVVGTDPKSDVAVIKVEGVNVTPARFGDSDKMQVGEWTIAIGNPMGLDHTVTVGVLSAKGREGFGMVQYADFLQTDAAINHGNSGGPLIDLDGNVIGINTMIRGEGMGLNFAIPSSMAKPIVEQLIKTGKVRRPYIGIKMQDVTPEMSRTFGPNAPEKGVIVGEVMTGSPADKAGVRAGDVIVRIDGKQIESSRNMQNTIVAKNVGQKVELAVWRDGKEQKLVSTTAEMPGDTTPGAGAAQMPAEQHGKIGLGLQNLTPDIAQELHVPRGVRGAVIGQVREDSPAEEAGLKRGDVITEVDRHAVSNADEAMRSLGRQSPNGHLLRVQREDQSQYVVVPAP
ncbi:MAG: Do family serine endopeptidase [Polyangia bacterium]